MRDAELTQWFSVPSVLTYMAKHDVVGGRLPLAAAPALVRRGLPTPALIHWMRRLPHVHSRTCTARPRPPSRAATTTCPDPGRPRRAGPDRRGLRRRRAARARRRAAACPGGRDGDLYIGGVGLRPGYWRTRRRRPPRSSRIRATAGRSHLPTGDLARAARRARLLPRPRRLADQEPRLPDRAGRDRGGASTRIGEIGECAVVGIDTDGFEGTRSAVPTCQRGRRARAGGSARAARRSDLPAYMLPSRWLRLEQSPEESERQDRSSSVERAVRARRRPGCLTASMNVMLVGGESAGLHTLKTVTRTDYKLVAVLASPSRSGFPASGLPNLAANLGVPARPAQCVHRSGIRNRSARLADRCAPQCALALHHRPRRA